MIYTLTMVCHQSQIKLYIGGPWAYNALSGITCFSSLLSG